MRHQQQLTDQMTDFWGRIFHNNMLWLKKKKKKRRKKICYDLKKKEKKRERKYAMT